ncbi:MAG: tRNA pseudouridine(38-40) synthase TruA [Verrucomicrobiota bacterium]
MSVRRLKLVLAYNGQGFEGWQSQKHGRTIQDEMERAFSRIVGARVAVMGAGRTDAGVHALGQCAHADVPGQKLTPGRWLEALNAFLPSTIRILRARWVSAKFHARFSAKGKTYRYRIVNSPVMSPLDLDRAWHVRTPLDRTLLVQATGAFLGTHDFAAFAANRGRKESSTTRTVVTARVRGSSEQVELVFSGDGFLYKMVRLIAGTVVGCALGKDTVEEILRRLADPQRPGSRTVAPAGGLYLMRVRY